MPYLRRATVDSITLELHRLREEAQDHPGNLFAEYVESKCSEMIEMLNGEPAWAGSTDGYMNN